jgi:S-adenosylmethionine synthetase
VLQLSNAIGVSKPLSVYVDTYRTGEVDEQRLGRLLGELMDLSPRGIREHLQLNRPIYARTAAYGHFGRACEEDGGFSWERTDLVDELRRAYNSGGGPHPRHRSASEPPRSVGEGVAFPPSP